MIDFTNTNIEKVAAHFVGNKTNSEEIILSKSLLDLSDLRLRELLFSYFLSSLPKYEHYCFTFSNGDIKLNPIFSFATEIFESTRKFHKVSIDIAKYLYGASLHPQIKSGDFFVCHFSNVHFAGGEMNAIGFFKSENRQSFLKPHHQSGDFYLEYDDGINIDSLDKGCLILNIDKADGYKVLIVDKSNKSSEAQFWKDSFLCLKPCNDEYYNTNQFLSITKNYVTKQYPNDFEVQKADQIDMLNRSVEYFKNHDTFDKREFEKEVLFHPEVIKSFRTYDNEFRVANELEIEDSFEISGIALKKQARAFKSVLKLDKNFHIYIHGNKDLIERGVEKDGRKYYKIYYTNES